MAFPTIPTVAAGRVLSVVATSPAGTHTSPNLTSLTKNAGDLLIAIVVIYDGNSTNAEFSAWGGGFTEFSDNAGTATMGIGCAYKFSTGSETGTFTVTSADTSTNDSAFFLLSIPGAHPTAPPEAGGFATGTSAAADPASVSPSWGADDTLWIAVGGSGEDSGAGAYTGVTAAPTNYTSFAESGISADVVGGIDAGVAFRQLTSGSENVGTFTVDLSNARNSALVIAVRPITAVFDQKAFRGRNSDGNETTATWIAAENVNWSITGTGYHFKIRFVVQETAGGSTAKTYKLQYSLNGGSWTDVTGASDPAISDENTLDGTATTDQIGGTGTFVAGNFVGIGGTSASITIPANGHTEIEYGILWTSPAPGDSIQFRVIIPVSTVLGAYSNIPTLTFPAFVPFTRSMIQLLSQ